MREKRRARRKTAGGFCAGFGEEKEGETEKEPVLLSGMVERVGKRALKYWFWRRHLFSRFDEGVRMDEVGLFSVTPEEIARHQAARCQSGLGSGSGSGQSRRSGLVVDAFTGVGGNAIQFALMNLRVIAIDINPRRIECAQHNARLYEVVDRIDFVIGNFYQLAPTLKADVIFLSPPWGGPDYKKADIFDIETMLQPKNGFSLFKAALDVAPNVAIFLPRTVDREQLEQLSWLCSPPISYEIEENFVNDKLKGVTAYYGKIASHKEYECSP